MQIGRRIYYDKATGNIILDTGERSGDVVETAVEQDFAAYAALAERVPDTVGHVQLQYGEYAQDFMEGRLNRIDLNTLQPVFSYPDPSNPEQPLTPQTPLSAQVSELRQAVNDLTALITGAAQ